MLVLLLVEQYAEAHNILPIKHAIIEKIFICMHSLLAMPLFSFSRGGNPHYPKICVWWLCDEKRPKLPLLLFGDVPPRMSTLVPRCSEQCDGDVQGIPRHKCCSLLRVTDLRVWPLAALWSMTKHPAFVYVPAWLATPMVAEPPQEDATHVQLHTVMGVGTIFFQNKVDTVHSGELP